MLIRPCFYRTVRTRMVPLPMCRPDRDPREDNQMVLSPMSQETRSRRKRSGYRCSRQEEVAVLYLPALYTRASSFLLDQQNLSFSLVHPFSLFSFLSFCTYQAGPCEACRRAVRGTCIGCDEMIPPLLLLLLPPLSPSPPPPPAASQSQPGISYTYSCSTANSQLLQKHTIMTSGCTPACRRPGVAS